MKTRQKYATLLMTTVIMSVVATTFTAQSFAVPVGDPHVKARGEMKTEWFVGDDGMIHFIKKFTSEELHNKKGIKTIKNEELIPLDQWPQDMPTSGSQTAQNVDRELLMDSDSPKLKDLYDAKSNGVSSYMYEKWDVVDEEQQSTLNADLTIPTLANNLIQPLTHVPKWAGKDTTVWTKYDPIDLIWQDQST